MTQSARPVRLGLIGLGPWGLRHAATIAACDGLRLSAAATARPEAARQLPSGVHVYADWRRLLEHSELDAVVVATPPGPRPGIAEAALKAGLAALLEKPAALELGAMERLAALSAARGVLLSVAHLHLYAPAFLSLQAAVQAAGGARRIESIGGGPGPHRADYSALWDYGPHDLSMIRALAGRIADQVGAQRLMVGDSAQDGLWRLTLAFRTGSDSDSADLAATVHVGNVMRDKSRLLSVETAQGRFIYDDRAPVKAIHVMADGESRQLTYAGTPPLTATLQRFARLVEAGVTADPDLPAAVDVVRMLSAAEDSLASGAPVGGA